MSSKDEIIESIRMSALTSDEYMEICQATFEAMLGQQLLGAGMDLATGNRVVEGYWTPAPMCRKEHHADQAGWRDADGLPYHEHWVPK